MNSVVLDASALMAFLRNEAGADTVRAALNSAAISAVNLSEVLAKATESSIGFDAVKSSIRGLQLRVVAFDVIQSELAAGLRPATRELGLSLGDRCCLALGLVEGSAVMTTDKSWGALKLGIPIHVIR